MPIGVKSINLPVTYEVSDYVDDRFKKVKIWIAHTGENLNYSIFTKESLEKMSETLPYVPIVGYIEKNEEDENDFSDHRNSITIKDGDVNIEYMCHAYGFIPEGAKSSFEIRDGKEWLVGEGYLWTKFEKSVDIFSNSNNSKSQSMEIDNIDGFIDNEGRVNVDNARFSALCILGDNVAPGMQGSTIEMFNANSVKDEIKEMVYEFSKKGDKSLEKDTKEKVDEFVEEKDKEDKTDTKKAKTDSDKKDTEEKVEDVKKNAKKEDEEAKAKSKDEKDSDETDEDKKKFVEKDEEDTKDKEDVEKEDDKEKKFQLVFEISHEDIRRSLYSSIANNDENEWNWIVEIFDDHFIYQHENYKDGKVDNKFYDVKYTVENDYVSIGEKVEVFSKFLTKEEFDKIDADRNRVEELETELTTLKEFKAEKETADKMEILETYSEKLSEEKFKEFSEGIANFEAKDLEKEIAYALFKQDQVTEAENKAGGVAVYTAKSNETTGKYGDLDRLFEK